VYALTHFGDFPLARFETRTHIGPGSTQAEWLLLPNGSSIRVDGTGTAAPAGVRIPLYMEFVEETSDALETRVRELHALHGKEYRLWREWFATGERQWRPALLTKLDCVHEPGQHLFAAYELEWYCPAAYWRGRYHGTTTTLGVDLTLQGILPLGVIEEVHDLDESPKSLAINTNGTAPVLDAVLTITAGSEAITYLKMEGIGTAWEYFGTIAAGQALVVDCGKDTVRNNGVDAYAQTYHLAAHTANNFLLLPAGSPAIFITYTSASDDHTLLLEFWEAHV
jgi:hypothetical protein